MKQTKPLQEKKHHKMCTKDLCWQDCPTHCSPQDKQEEKRHPNQECLKVTGALCIKCQPSDSLQDWEERYFCENGAFHDYECCCTCKFAKNKHYSLDYVRKTLANREKQVAEDAITKFAEHLTTIKDGEVDVREEAKRFNLSYQSFLKKYTK